MWDVSFGWVGSPLRKNRDFAALWIGQAVSHLGISISSFAYPVVVLELTGSAAKAGAVGSVLAGTAFVLRLPAGVAADRWNRRARMVACDLGRAINSAAFAVALALGYFVFAQALAVAFVEAALGVLFGPAESASVRRVVGPERIREAVAQNQSRTAISGLLGPPLGGVLLSVGRALPFLADSFSYLVSLASVLSVRSPLGGRGQPASRQTVVDSLSVGLRWIWRRRFLRTLLLWMMAGSGVWGGIGLLVLVVARDHGASAGVLGVMFAITGAGALVGALATPWVLRAARPHTIIISFGWLVTVSLLLLLVVQQPLLIGVLGATSLLLVPPINAIAFSVIGAEASDEIQGQATSAGIQLAGLGAPVAPLLLGLVLAAVGTQPTIMIYSGILCALAIYATISTGLREASN